MVQRRFVITGHKLNAVYRFSVKAVSVGGAGAEKTPRVVFYECAQFYTNTGTGCQVGCTTTITAPGGLVCSYCRKEAIHCT